MNGIPQGTVVVIIVINEIDFCSRIANNETNGTLLNKNLLFNIFANKCVGSTLTHREEAHYILRFHCTSTRLPSMYLLLYLLTNNTTCCLIHTVYHKTESTTYLFCEYYLSEVIEKY